jgi:probable HAF family extracellular repeat protein
MNSRKLMCIQGIVLLVAVVVPVGLAAQDKQDHQHHHYKFVDLGTLGGPASYFSAGGAGNRVLNNKGVVGSYADTSTPDPNAPNCFNPDCFVSHAFRWKDGILNDLGAIANSSEAVGINERGWIAGVSQNGVIDPLTGFPEGVGVLWKDDGEMVNLGTLDGGYESLATDVNDAGQVTGFFTNTTPSPYDPLFGGQVRTFLWQNGVMQDLGTLGGPESSPVASPICCPNILINERGQIAGSSFTNNIPDPITGVPTTDPFLWQNGIMTDLGTLGGTLGAAISLNNRGQVAGYSNLAGNTVTHAFLWDAKNGMKDLGTLGGTSIGVGWLNDSGEVVGASYTANDQFIHATLWRDGEVIDLGTADGFCGSTAQAVNAAGQIVGDTFTCDGSIDHAAMWDHGSAVDLNTLIPPNSSLTLITAWNINDRGEIGGDGATSNGDNHAFLLIPCDDAHPGIEGCDYSMVEANLAASFRAGDSALAKLDPSASVRAGTPPRELALMPYRLGRRYAAWSQRIASPLTPRVQFNPTSLNFGTVYYGQTSTKPTTLTNAGSTTLQIYSITITGTDPSYFSQANNCGSMVGAGKSCSIQVTFKPEGFRFPRSFTASVSVSDNAGGSPQTVPLSGTGEPQNGGYVGYCELDTQSGKLNGTCLGPGQQPNQCAAKYNPSQCPPGDNPIAPTNFVCLFNVDRVDAGRSCVD